MNCKRAEKLLVEYLYEELAPKRTVALEKHLQVCDSCSKTLENWQSIRKGYQKTAAERASSPYLKQRILVAAREELGRPSSTWQKFSSFLKPAIVAPVLVFATLALFVTAKKDSTTNFFAKAKKPASVAPQAPAVQDERRRPYNEDAQLSATRMEGEAGAKERGKSALKQEYRENKPLESVEEAEKRPAREDESYPSSRDAITAQTESDYKESKLGAKKKESDRPATEGQDLNVSQPAAAPSVGIQEPLAKTQVVSDDASTSFARAQNTFKNDQLNQGNVEAKDAISKDKSGTLASQFHQAGIQYQQNKAPQQAIVQYNLVLNNYPAYSDAPDVLLRLGDTYTEIGQYENAIKVFRQLEKYAAMKKIASERISSLRKQQNVQEQLRSLGYVDKN